MLGIPLDQPRSPVTMPDHHPPPPTKIPTTPPMTPPDPGRGSPLPLIRHVHLTPGGLPPDRPAPVRAGSSMSAAAGNGAEEIWAVLVPARVRGPGHRRGAA